MSATKYPILLTTATLFLALIGWVGGRAPALHATQGHGWFQAQTPGASAQQPVGRLHFIDNETARKAVLPSKSMPSMSRRRAVIMNCGYVPIMARY